jgi:four helix bundle protein
MRRAAISISANIAEGCARSTDADFRRFIDISAGSASEVECLLLLAQGLGYLSPSAWEEIFPQVEEVKKMLCSLAKTLRGDKH